MPNLIELRDVSLAFHDGTEMAHSVLDEVNLSVAQGEFLILIGRNGAGKSSLLKVLAREILPNSGTVTIHSNLSLPVLTVLQNPEQGTIGDFTLEENLSFSLGRGRGLSLYNTQRKHFDALLDSVGLFGKMDRLAKTLSGGQRQALSLLMAMLTQAPILLLDEITSALDVSMADFVMNKVAEAVAMERKTVIAVTHNIAHALRYGNRLILMDCGRVIAQYQGAAKAKLSPMDLCLQLGVTP